MITAEEAREITCKDRWQILEKLIKEAAQNNNYSVSLHDNGFGKLTNLDKRMLVKNGYIITEGNSGKGDKFDIINW